MRRAAPLFLGLWLAGCTPPPTPGVSSGQKVDPLPPSEPRVAPTKVKFDVGFAAPPAIEKTVTPPQPRPTKTEHRHCGEASRAEEGEAPRLRAVGKKGAVELELRGYRSYCDPKPVFSAGLAGETVVVAEEAHPPGTPLSRCTCLHDVSITVSDLPAGEHAVEVYSRLGADGDPVPSARATVTIPP